MSDYGDGVAADYGDDLDPQNAGVFAAGAPTGNLRRTAEDGVVIEEFDPETAPTLAEMLKRK